MRSWAAATRCSTQRPGRIYKIGRYPEWTLIEGQERCRELRRLVDAGLDPFPKTVVPVITVCEAWQLFDATRLKKRSAATKREYTTQMEQFVFERWGNVPIDKISRRELVQLHAEITASGRPTRTNRLIATVSSFYGWLYAADIYKGENPARKIERNIEHGREVYLTPAQISAVRSALAQYAVKPRGNAAAADCVEFCIATGCRSGEAKSATWDQFDEDLSTWVKPSNTTKQRKTHRVPLSFMAQDILRGRKAKRKRDEQAVFSDVRELAPVWAYVRGREW